jgi:endogenous inhibitor of DNA gyrase (YacG/DUF329 family)
MPTVVKCPSCRAEAVWDGNPFRPFCSERCKAVDLGDWLTDAYRIPGERVRGGADGDEDEG